MAPQEATFESGAAPGAWELQTLTAAAHLGALVLEIERAHRQLSRGGAAAGGRPRSGAVSTLIGAAPAMQRLRAQIARVARTDFTILPEGGSGPQV
jgi:DNA-binding NtrC family response regulator